MVGTEQAHKCGRVSPVAGKTYPEVCGWSLHTRQGGIMGKALILWWVGVPGIIVLLLYLFVF